MNFESLILILNKTNKGKHTWTIILTMRYTRVNQDNIRGNKNRWRTNSGPGLKLFPVKTTARCSYYTK